MSVRQQSAFASAARTATPTAAVLEIEDDALIAEAVIAVTAVTSTPSVVFNLEGQDDTGAWYVILASAAIATVSTTRLVIGSPVTAVANQAAQAALPSQLRVRPVHGNGNSITYSVAVRTR